MDGNISSKIEQIFSMIEKLRANIEKIQKKIIDINKVIVKFKLNKLLDENNSYLTFQIKLLTNEKTYYETMKNIILEKMFGDMLNIYGRILMLLTSLENLDIEHEEEKNNIIDKIQTYKREDKIDCSNTMSLASATVGNLQLINRFIEIFNDYITKLDKESNLDNIHCNNLTTNLVNRKSHIHLEYTRFSNQLDELVGYFLKCSNYVTSQLDKQELINFLVEKNNAE